MFNKKKGGDIIYLVCKNLCSCEWVKKILSLQRGWLLCCMMTRKFALSPQPKARRGQKRRGSLGKKIRKKKLLEKKKLEKLENVKNETRKWFVSGLGLIHQKNTFQNTKIPFDRVIFYNLFYISIKYCFALSSSFFFFEVCRFGGIL